MKSLQTELIDKGFYKGQKDEVKLSNGRLWRKPQEKERLTSKDLRDLMGVNRPTYTRVRGRVRKR